MNVQQCSLYSFMITIERYMHKSNFFLIERFISKGYDFNIVVKSLNPDFSDINIKPLVESLNIK
jgi:hypothetical protein